MSWRQSEGTKITGYNDQFMYQERVAETCGGTFQLPGVIDIVLKDKHSGVSVSELDSTSKKELNNELLERVLAVVFIENANSRIYSELEKNLK